MKRPWMQWSTRDWLDNKELRRCTPAARAILTDLMCLAHEGVPYGHLSDKVGPLAESYMASRCHVRLSLFRKSVAELERAAERLKWVDGCLIIPRMVEDEKVRVKRASGGHLGGNPKLRRKVASKVNLTSNHQGYPPPHMSADTPSGSESGSSHPEGGRGPGEGFADWIEPIRARHPNPSQFNVGIQLLTERSDCDEPAFRQEFSNWHQQWSTHWKHNENGRFAPKFADFVLNWESYRKGPPAKQRQQTAYEKLQAASGGESA